MSLVNVRLYFIWLTEDTVGAKSRTVIEMQIVFAVITCGFWRVVLHAFPGDRATSDGSSPSPTAQQLFVVVYCGEQSVENPFVLQSFVLQQLHLIVKREKKKQVFSSYYFVLLYANVLQENWVLSNYVTEWTWWNTGELDQLDRSFSDCFLSPPILNHYHKVGMTSWKAGKRGILNLVAPAWEL